MKLNEIEVHVKVEQIDDNLFSYTTKLNNKKWRNEWDGELGMSEKWNEYEIDYWMILSNHLVAYELMPSQKVEKIQLRRDQQI